MKLRSWRTRSRRASRSSSAPGTASSSPARGPPSATAIALTVKSRRRRSSLERRGGHVRERARVGVGLAPGAGDVVAEARLRSRSPSRSGRARRARRRAAPPRRPGRPPPPGRGRTDARRAGCRGPIRRPGGRRRRPSQQRASNGAPAGNDRTRSQQLFGATAGSRGHLRRCAGLEASPGYHSAPCRVPVRGAGCGGGSSPWRSCWWCWEARWRSSCCTRLATSPTRTSSSRARPSTTGAEAEGRRSSGRATGYDAARTRDFDPARQPRSAVPGRLEVPGLRAARVPAGDLRPHAVSSSTTTAPPRRSTRATATSCGRRRSARSRPPRPRSESPRGSLFVPILSTNANAARTQAPGNGKLVALSMKTGHVVWSHRVPPGTESSPLAWQNAVYFGDQSGTVYSLNARDRARQLDLSRQRRGQGRTGAGVRPAVLRRLRRPRVRAQPGHRAPDLGGQHQRRRLRLRQRQLLLDAGGRVRARVHG